VFIDLGDEDPAAALMTAVQAAPFRVVAASYHSPLTALADVVLPVETSFELSGHYLNLEGRWQVAHGALAAPSAVRSNVAVLTGLAERLGLTLNLAWPAGWDAQRRRWRA
jgi:NADH dehydrogenase/NADH:ubiquinone oxidoreductase subunit G